MEWWKKELIPDNQPNNTIITHHTTTQLNVWNMTKTQCQWRMSSHTLQHRRTHAWLLKLLHQQTVMLQHNLHETTGSPSWRHALQASLWLPQKYLKRNRKCYNCKVEGNLNTTVWSFWSFQWDTKQFWRDIVKVGVFWWGHFKHKELINVAE